MMKKFDEVKEDLEDEDLANKADLNDRDTVEDTKATKYVGIVASCHGGCLLEVDSTGTNNKSNNDRKNNSSNNESKSADSSAMMDASNSGDVVIAERRSEFCRRLHC